MNDTQFCYWLMGFYEIEAVENNSKKFTPQQCLIICQHLQLVKSSMKNRMLQGFVAWFDGFVEAKDGQFTSALDYDKILINLREHFKNVIDKTYGGKEPALYQIHNGRTEVAIAKC